MTDMTPGQTMARQAAEQLRGGGATSWKGPAFTNPRFAPPEAFEFAFDGGLQCGNCSGPSKRIAADRRECIRCRARWQTSAQTSEELAVEKFKAQEAAR